MGTFFELIGKALLLHEDYVIHKIRNKRAPDDILALGSMQQRKPVPVTDYLNVDSFVEIRNSQLPGGMRNGLAGLTLQTVSYSTIYNMQDYRDALSLSVAFKNLGAALKDFRNLIHLPVAGSQTIKNASLPGPKEINEIIQSELETSILPKLRELITLHDLAWCRDEYWSLLGRRVEDG